MTTAILRTWLKLPEQPWPPDHYALIDLKPGAGTTIEIEERVLERLELLRRYQLSHPDEVTEGMNLLARALNCLTDPDSRRDYDRSLGLKTREAEAAPSAAELLRSLIPGVPVLSARLEDVPELDDRPKEGTAEAAILPDVIELPDIEDDDGYAEVEGIVDDEPLEAVLVDESATKPPTSNRPSAESGPGDAVPPSLPKRKRTHLEAPQTATEDIPDPPPLPKRKGRKRRGHRDDRDEGDREADALGEAVDRRADRGGSRSDPRAIYREMARLRRVLRVLNRARGYFIDPEQTFSRRMDSLGLMSCMAELRPLIPSTEEWLGRSLQPGSLLFAFGRQRYVVDMFRNLIPSQREAIAEDFRLVHFRLAERYRHLRSESEKRRQTRPIVRRIVQPIRRKLHRYPELIMIPFVLGAVLVAVIRG